MAAVKESQRSDGSLLDYDSVEVGGCEQATASRDAIVGFDEYLITIKDQLCGQSTNLRIIPIVGMGGIGKTTLARITFDDSLILHHFYCRAWTTVSQGYSLESVLKTILNSLTGMTIDLPEGGKVDKLKERIYKSLKGQRYLIVLDDVWSEKFWDDIQLIFPNDRNGSRILITTRLLDLAHLVAGSSGFIHEMQFLNVDASWNLLREKVFSQEDCAPQLEKIGRFIASKCGGLPLAIVVIAGMLSNFRTPQYWEKVAKNVGSILHRDDENLSNILSLSFNHLSHQLKACFLYMGCLPEYYQVRVTRLTSLWTAEGFLRSADGSKTSEQVAEECLGDLVKRNLVLVTKRRANGQFKYCTIHDVLRDFCRDRALQECFFHGMDWQRYLSIPRVENVRRIIPYSYPDVPSTLGTMSGTLSKQPCSFRTCKFVRSILLFDRTRVKDNTDYSFEWDNFKLLRVLDIAYVQILLWAPWDVSSMFLLKHLTIDIFFAHKQFDSIFKLPCLETLILYGPKYRRILLPSEFWKAPRLRFLRAYFKMILPPATLVGGVVVHKLEYLQTLETVMNFLFTKEAIEMIPNLRKLKTMYGGLGVNDIWKQYCLNNLVHLQQLEELTIMFSEVKRFPSSVAFPLNLKKLSLRGCRLPWKELAVVGSLPCLQMLRLKDKAFVGEKWEAVEEEFLQLKFLLLEGLDLKYWSADRTHFPCLEHLKIIRCYNLLEIPSEIGDIPTLKLITVQYSSRGAGDSAEQICNEQRDNGNDELQVLLTMISIK